MNIHQHPKDPASTWTDNINEHDREGELHGSTYMGVRTDRCGWWAGFPRGDQKKKGQKHDEEQRLLFVIICQSKETEFCSMCLFSQLDLTGNNFEKMKRKGN